jgi:outer membrane protein TolC
VVNAFQNVADALRAVQFDADALKANVEAERSAEDSYRIAKMQFDAGSLTYLTLLTTEQQYQQTNIALAQAQAQRFTDTAALFQALGGGWWNRADIPNEDEADYRHRIEGDKP